MLANQYGFFQTWQVPFILLFVVGWIFGGGYLFHKTLSKFPSQKRMKLGKGILISLLSGAVGGITALIVFLTFKKVLDMPIVSIVIAVPFFPIMAYLVVFAMFKESFGETLRASLLPLGGILVLTGIIGTTCGVPTIMSRRAYMKQRALQTLTAQNLNKIFLLIEHRQDKPPKSLEEILTMKDAKPEWFKSPANPSREIGFFYLQPNRLGRLGRDRDIQKILACDFGDNFAEYPEPGRVVLYTHGSPGFLLEASFESLLKKPENKEFAEALEKAESK